MKSFRVLAHGFLILSISFGVCHAQWVQTNAPTGKYFRSLISNGSIQFAGDADGGGIYRSSDNGTSWVQANNGLSDSGIKFLAVSGAYIFAVSDNNVYRTSDSGNSWSLAGSGLGGYHIAVRGMNQFVGTWNSGVWRSSDNGATWIQIGNGLTDGLIRGLDTNGAALLAGTPSGIFRTLDTNWTLVNNGLPAGMGAGPLYASGAYLYAALWNNNGLYRTSDSGANWTAVNNGLTNRGIQALASGGGLIFAGTATGLLFSPDSGDNWFPSNSGLTDSSLVSLAVNGTNLFAGTNGNGIWRRPLSEMMPVSIHLTRRIPAEIEWNSGIRILTGTRIGFWVGPRSQVNIIVYDAMGKKTAPMLKGK